VVFYASEELWRAFERFTGSEKSKIGEPGVQATAGRAKFVPTEHLPAIHFSFWKT
jgi:hypothetical protein